MKKIFFVFILVFITVLLVGLIFLFNHSNILPFPKTIFYAEDFGISSIQSSTDFDQDGIDDYTDIMLGARQDALNRPIYKSAY